MPIDFDNQSLLNLTKTCKVKNRGLAVVFSYFLSTDKFDHLQINTRFRRRPDTPMDVFSFPRHAFFKKWENSEIDTPERV